ncbi:hypothetical protein OC835_006257 [Tilletia horrida]|nr:hypothetical protein OC835_006257 [Tilletia horrida]
MPTTVSAQAEDLLKARIGQPAATLWITVSTKAMSECNFVVDDRLCVENVRNSACAQVSLSPAPGTGHNFLHRGMFSKGTPANREICALTAKLLDLQRVLEMALIYFNVRMGPDEHDTEALRLLDNYDSADFARYSAQHKVDPIQSLTAFHLKSCLWDFVQPDIGGGVVMHVQLTQMPNTTPPPYLPSALAGLSDSWQRTAKALQGQCKAQAKEAPSQALFKSAIPQQLCAITRSSYPLEGCHILPRPIPPRLIQAAFDVLFVSHYERPPRQHLPLLPLFSAEYKVPMSWLHTMDGMYNGIMLEPSLHRVFDAQHVIYILAGKVYLFGTPTGRAELHCFSPSCPAQIHSHHVKESGLPDEISARAWQLQLQSESCCQELEAHVGFTQHAALHVRACLAFYKSHMKDTAVIMRLQRSINAQMEQPVSSLVPPNHAHEQARAAAGAATAAAAAAAAGTEPLSKASDAHFTIAAATDQLNVPPSLQASAHSTGTLRVLDETVNTPTYGCIEDVDDYDEEEELELERQRQDLIDDTNALCMLIIASCRRGLGTIATPLMVPTSA